MRLMALGTVVAMATWLGFAGEARAQDRAAAAAEELDAPVPKHTHFAMRLAGGGTGRALYDSYLVGGEGSASFGVDSPYGFYALRLGFFGGMVEGGLTAIHGTAGFDLAWPIGIVRLGLSPRVGYLDIDRVTTERQFGAYTFGVAAHASVDLVRRDGVAFALAVEPSADVAAAFGNDGRTSDSAAPLLGGTAFLEVRWRRAD